MTNDLSTLTEKFHHLWVQLATPAVGGSILLAINCALLGTYLVVRRMALTSDTLSHAVLPGIVGGFVWQEKKDPLSLLVGAVVSGLLGTWLLNAITSTTKLKSDAAQGIILSFFLGMGVCLFRMLDTALPTADKAGLKDFLFGQISAMGTEDVLLLAIALALSVVTVVLGYRNLLVLSFDKAYGLVRGLPVRLIHAWFMFLTTVAIVVSMSTVGVVLISALMVIPVSAAALLTRRLPRLLLLSMGIGAVSAFVGTSASRLWAGLAPGPCVVLSSSFFFAMAFVLSPHYGPVARRWRSFQWHRRVKWENALKDIYRWLEDTHQLVPAARGTASAFAMDRNRTPKAASHQLQKLASMGYLHLQPSTTGAEGTGFTLTETGLAKARQLVRAHRLWELYLTQRAAYATDHVHADAEEMEHMLTPDNLERLAQSLGSPTHDPHGREIPQLSAG
jgi:ABC-type Mn2+/Zn2+ transport system permease subunit/Mn-dependent DtxR family transcriptional regulator